MLKSAFNTFIIMMALTSLSTKASTDNTEHSYQSYRDNFCNIENDNGGEKILEGLDKINEAQFARSEQLKKEINADNSILGIIKEILLEKEKTITIPMKQASVKELKTVVEVAKKNPNLPQKEVRLKMCERFEDKCDSNTGGRANLYNFAAERADKARNIYDKGGIGEFFGTIDDKKFNEFYTEYEGDKAVRDDKEAMYKHINQKCYIALENYGSTQQRLDPDNQYMHERLSSLRDLCKEESLYKIENPESPKAGKEFVDNFNAPAVEMQKKINELKDIHSTRKFNKIELFKAYVAKQYLCQCAKDVEVTPNVVRSCFAEEKHDQISTTAVTLSGDISDVLKKISFANNLYDIDNKNCTRSDDLIRSISEECKLEQNPAPSIKRVCLLASGERVGIDRRNNEEKKWQDLNKEYWIRKDSKAKDGFVRTKKMKTWELIGEGIKPVVPSIVPIWFANHQMKSNINMLTQQALEEKQFNHTIDIYNQNPWMYSYPFLFQQNAFPIYSNPFSGTFQNQTTTLNPSGYNFGMP